MTVDVVSLRFRCPLELVEQNVMVLVSFLGLQRLISIFGRRLPDHEEAPHMEQVVDYVFFRRSLESL